MHGLEVTVALRGSQRATYYSQLHWFGTYGRISVTATVPADSLFRRLGAVLTAFGRGKQRPQLARQASDVVSQCRGHRALRK